MKILLTSLMVVVLGVSCVTESVWVWVSMLVLYPVTLYYLVWSNE